MDDDVISVNEAANILHVHPETVRRLFDAGQLTGWRTKPPRGWRKIHRASVEAYRRRQHGEKGEQRPPEATD